MMPNIEPPQPNHPDLQKEYKRLCTEGQKKISARWKRMVKKEYENMDHAKFEQLSQRFGKDLGKLLSIPSGQMLHKDVHFLDLHEDFDEMPESWDCSRNGFPRCISIQVQLTDTTLGGKMGSLEVLPGSHRPDTGVSPADIAKAVRDPCDSGSGVIPVNVAPGTVTIYSSRLWHRGGANESKKHRQFCFFTATENQQNVAPPGLIHTMQMSDVGTWCISSSGLTKT